MRPNIRRDLVVLDEGRRPWSFEELDEQIHALANHLREQGTQVLATLMGNSAAWVVADRAALAAEVVHVPLPPFFTAEQVAHACVSSGVDTVLTVRPMAMRWPR